MTTRAPVSLHAPAAFGDGVTARIVSSRAIHVQAVGPGQVSGPGVNLVVEVTNHSTKAIDLGAAVVTVADARGTPGVLMVYAPETTADADVPAVPSDSFSHPMTGSLAPNATARGTYVFTVPAEHRNPLTVHVSYAGDSPVVVFAGNLS